MLGGVWFHADTVARHAFLYNITVFSSHRRQRVASDALLLVQERARSLGCWTMALNVFATHVGAMDLYRKMGFSVVSSHMNKAL